MIEINLLPDEHRKKSVNFRQFADHYRFLLIPAVSIVLAIILTMSLTILVYPKWQNRVLNRLESRWKDIGKDYEEVVKLTDQNKKLKNQIECIDKIMSARIIWAAKLNEISDAMPAEIQLTEIALEQEWNKIKTVPGSVIDASQLLLIAGIVPSAAGERAVEEFIKNLKNDSDFCETFPKMELSFIEAVEGGYKRFMLKCYVDAKYDLKADEKQEEKNEEISGKKKANDKKKKVKK